MPTEPITLAVSVAKLGLAALTYVGLGLHVLPLWGVEERVCLCRKGPRCNDPGKHPMGHLVPRGKDDASNDSRKVCAWWTAEPSANIGIACEPSSLLVVDIDPRNGGDATWEGLIEKHGQPDDTWESETGGGRHIVFKRPSHLEVRDSMLPPGIDIKANGYVVAAPSMHASGREYIWLADADPIDGMALALPPDWLINEIKMRRRASTIPLNMDGLKYVSRAETPQVFLDALISDDVLQGIWERTRRPQNQKDESPSGWTMSLWKRLLGHRLTPQDVLGTMIAYRRKHHDRNKGPVWYVNEAAQYAADLAQQSSSLSSVSPPPPALRRNPRSVDLIRDVVEQAIRHGEELPPRTSSERLLLIHLAGYARDGEFVWPSQERLAKTMGLTADRISRLIRNLERWGCIEKVRHSGPGVPNKYRLRFLDILHEHTA